MCLSLKSLNSDIKFKAQCYYNCNISESPTGTVMSKSPIEPRHHEWSFPINKIQMITADFIVWWEVDKIMTEKEVGKALARFRIIKHTSFKSFRVWRRFT